MESPVDITQSADIKTAKASSKRENLTFRSVFLLSVLFLGCSLVFFSWKRWDSLTLSAPIISELFGTLGDFVGGILGTFIALYSVYMLVRSFQNQTITNANVITTNESVINTNNKLLSQTELQIFDSRFSTLLDLYKDSVASYNADNNQRGRIVFEKIVEEFKTKGLSNKTEYKRRNIGAVSEYVDLYVTHRRNFSVHFRMLYLLAKLTAEEKIQENHRVSYAKSLRGQLSEGEMLMLRYNCLSPYGEKMRIYVNKFNLTKHLPVMSLLEFTRWRNLIREENQRSSMNQMFILLKKRLTGLLDRSGAVEDTVRLTPRILFAFHLGELHDSLIITFSMQKNKKIGGAIKRPLEENAFDCFSEIDLCLYLKEIFLEMFIYSNFFKFNGSDSKVVSSSIVESSEKEIKVEISIERKGISLALADRQLEPS